MSFSSSGAPPASHSSSSLAAIDDYALRVSAHLLLLQQQHHQYNSHVHHQPGTSLPQQPYSSYPPFPPGSTVQSGGWEQYQYPAIASASQVYSPSPFDPGAHAYQAPPRDSFVEAAPFAEPSNTLRFSHTARVRKRSRRSSTASSTGGRRTRKHSIHVPPPPPPLPPPPPPPSVTLPQSSAPTMFDKHTGNGHGNKMNERLNVLEGLLSSMAGEGTTAKANTLRHAIRKSKADCADTPTKALDLMRRIFQKEITNELRQIVERHLRTTFSPAIENLRRNGHDVGEVEVNALGRSIFEAAKESFGGIPRQPRKRAGRDIDLDTDLEDEVPSKQRRFGESEDESDGSVMSFTTPSGERKRRRPRSKKDEEAILNDSSTVTIKDALAWNPDRFTPQSRFLFASRVAATINMPTSMFFAKYPRFFRYVCDEDDKNELYDAGRLSRLTGRAVLVLLEDAFEVLGHSPEIERYSFPITESIFMRLRQRSQRVYESLSTRLATSNATHNAQTLVAQLFPFAQSPVMSFPVG